MHLAHLKEQGQMEIVGRAVLTCERTVAYEMIGTSGLSLVKSNGIQTTAVFCPTLKSSVILILRVNLVELHILCHLIF